MVRCSSSLKPSTTCQLTWPVQAFLSNLLASRLHNCSIKKKNDIKDARLQLETNTNKKGLPMIRAMQPRQTMNAKKWSQAHCSWRRWWPNNGSIPGLLIDRLDSPNSPKRMSVRVLSRFILSLQPRTALLFVPPSLSPFSSSLLPEPAFTALFVLFTLLHLLFILLRFTPLPITHFPFPSLRATPFTIFTHH